MDSAWYAAFGLLSLLVVTNSVVLVALLRQVGILHQRGVSASEVVPGIGGPARGAKIGAIQLQSLADTPENVDVWDRPWTVLAYVSTDCDVCDELPGVIRDFADSLSQSPDGREIASRSRFAVATDESPNAARVYFARTRPTVPFGVAPGLREHLSLRGAPYVTVLANDNESSVDKCTVLAGGVVNGTAQLERLIEMATEFSHDLAEQNTNPELRLVPRASAEGGLN